jgi:hypothetical protein
LHGFWHGRKVKLVSAPCLQKLAHSFCLESSP